MGIGKDHTLHALVEGTVTFKKRRNNRTYVSIVPEGEILTTVKKAAPKKAVKKETPAVPVAEKAAAPTPAPAPAPTPEPAPKAASTPDKLTKVEGIGPKVNELLNAAGIMTFSDLAGTSTDKIKDILKEAG